MSGFIGGINIGFAVLLFMFVAEAILRSGPDLGPGTSFMAAIAVLCCGGAATALIDRKDRR